MTDYLDPAEWGDTAREIGRETIDYVCNIQLIRSRALIE